MPPKRKNRRVAGKKPNRGKNSGRGRQGGFRSGHQKIIRASGRDESFSFGRIVHDGGGGTPTIGGIIYGGGSAVQLPPPSGTPIPDAQVGTFIPIVPAVIGYRAQQLADLYAQYRVRRLTVHIVPNTVATGDVASTVYPIAVSAGTATVSTALKFAVGVTYDPAIGPLSYEEIVESGGIESTIAGGRKTVTMRSNKWLYTTNNVTFGEIPTTEADLRQQSIGQLNWAWFSQTTGSTTGSNEFARGWCEWEIDFKDPLDPDSLPTFRRTPALANTISRFLRTEEKRVRKDPDDAEKLVQELHDCSDHPLSAPCDIEEEQKSVVYDKQLRSDLTKFVTRFKGSLPWVQVKVEKQDASTQVAQVANPRKGVGAPP
jgi:hypothetical protein